MKVRLSADARRDLRSYFYHIAEDDPRAARRERKRVYAELTKLASLPADGVGVYIEDWPRQVRRWVMHPFRAYYERDDHAGVLFVVRLYHHARRPIESADRTR